MENIPQLNTWKGLFTLVLLLIHLYWLLKLVSYALEQFAKRNLTNKNTIVAIKKSLLIFKPVALALVLLDFIAINYITHTILLTAVGVFGYAHIKNYINGIFLKINPLISVGAVIQIADYSGEIKKLLSRGMIVSTENGDYYMNYGTIESQGFVIKSDHTSLLRQTLYLLTDMPQEKLLDLLFDNPVLNYDQHPSLKMSDNNYLKLQYTLEPGASTKEFISFLEQHNIKASLTNNPIS